MAAAGSGLRRNVPEEAPAAHGGEGRRMAGQIPSKDGAAAPADGKKRLTELSKDEVAWILAHEPPCPHYDDDML